jgi:anti-sigma factor RsiW
MQCADLERYLEAFLDGRLGRSRSAILRRHLALCGGCRARVERLRQFERDMQRRFRSMEQTGSVWHGLELDLVASSRGDATSHLMALPRIPPPLRSHVADTLSPPGRGRRRLLLPTGARARGRASRFAGVVLIAMALGTVYQVTRTYLQPDDDVEAAAQAYLQLLRDDHTLAVHSEDAAQIRAWLSHELGRPVPEPPVPEGFRLVGADRAALATGAAGALVYGREAPAAASGDDSVVLFLQPLPIEEAASAGAPAGDGAAATAPRLEGRLHELTWEASSFRYTLVSREPPDEELHRFVR